MTENKTKPTDASVEDYMTARGTEEQRADCQVGDATGSTAARYFLRVTRRLSSRVTSNRGGADSVSRNASI